MPKAEEGSVESGCKLRRSLPAVLRPAEGRRQRGVRVELRRSQSAGQGQLEHGEGLAAAGGPWNGLLRRRAPGPRLPATGLGVGGCAPGRSVLHAARHVHHAAEVRERLGRQERAEHWAQQQACRREGRGVLATCAPAGLRRARRCLHGRRQEAFGRAAAAHRVCSGGHGLRTDKPTVPDLWLVHGWKGAVGRIKLRGESAEREARREHSHTGILRISTEPHQHLDGGQPSEHLPARQWDLPSGSRGIGCAVVSCRSSTSPA
mmetsp:Transcript_14349/g.54103  ORF Transcript_14349/g.54103 Transcript_14349/m.54103 type:complete len:262 (-) Transcript_14349:2638-3423(-)